MTDRLPIHALDTIGADATNDTPRYNSTTGRLEYAPGGGVSTTPSTIRETFAATVNGVHSITLGATPLDGTPMLWLNNVLLWPGFGYTITGSDIAITNPLVDGDDLWLSYQTTDPAPAASTLVPPTSTFDPRDIPDLLAWYSAEAVTGLADNTQINAWSDLSGNGNHATGTVISFVKPYWRAAGGAAGGPSVQVANDGYFALPNIMTGKTSGEIMVTVKADAATTPGGLMRFSDAGGSSHFPFSDGNIYENWGSSARPGITPTLSIASWRRYNIWSAANDWKVRIDETDQATSTSSTVTWITTPWIGASTATGPDTKFDGRIGCVVIYGRKLTTTERTDLATWLTDHPSGGTI